MSNPYASPEPTDPGGQQPGQQPGWSSQQPIPPTQGQAPYGQAPQAPNPYGQAPYGQPSTQQGSWSQSGGYATPQDGAYAQAGEQAPQAAYGQQGTFTQSYGVGTYVEVERLRSNSTIVLVLGILGIVQILPIIGGIVAWVWGGSLVRQGQEAGLPDDVTQNARIGRILGIISVALWGVLLAFFIVAVIFGVVVASNSGS